MALAQLLPGVDPNATSVFHSVGPITAVSGNTEYRCLIRDLSVPGSTNGGISRDATPLTMQPMLGAVDGSTTTFFFQDDGDSLACDGELEDGRSWTSITTDSAHAAGNAGVRVQRVSATFDYVAIMKID